MTSIRRSRPLFFVAFLLLHPVACKSAEPPSNALRGCYGRAVEELSSYIASELADKAIPGLSIALVDGSNVVWSCGFGTADPDAGLPASAETLYRVGSVSKLFTDIAVMQLVERGQLDLDQPVRNYLPEFRPDNPFGKEITLRQLMSHRSGLVREPPVGHYFDASSPTLAATVASLNGTTLVYEPETRVKYSNAAIAVVGYVLEELSGRPFAEYLEDAVLDPIGMEDSAFVPRERTARRLAKAVMWSYDGRSFPAPTFELGMAPAGSMYSTVLDLCDFMGMLLRRGAGTVGPVLRPESLGEMFTPQFAEEGATRGFGLGFQVGQIDGHLSLGHGGAIYGFATSLKVLPEAGLGVVAIANMDVVNSVTGRIVDQALRMMLAARAGRELPPPPMTQPVDPKLAKKLQGHYESEGQAIDLLSLNEKLVLTDAQSYGRLRVREGTLKLDDRLHNGPSLQLLQNGAARSIRIGAREFTPARATRPEPAPKRFQGLIGEYGWDHNVLFIFEKGGQLHALIEWIELDPLSEISESLFAFPERGLYHGEAIRFHRDESGRAHEAVVAGITFPRRALQGETVATFSIEPLQPVEKLRREALRADPPEETGDFHDTDLVEVTTLDPTIQLDIRYASTNNFMQARFYDEPRAFMQRPAAEAVVRVHRALQKQGYGLLIHDAYRPWYVTKMFWDATPDDSKIFVANPAKGSRHNRGCAVDLTLFDLKTQEPVEMVGLYDEMTERSFPEYQGGTALQRWHRDLLRKAMEAEGFSVYEYEWWHFDYEGWEHYRIVNQVFSTLSPGQGGRGERI